MNYDEKKKEPKSQEARELPTMCMNDLWEGLAMQPDDEKVHALCPSGDVERNAAFQATAPESMELGHSYARAESFYCTAHKIPMAERKKYSGRGKPTELKIKKMKEHGPIFSIFADFKADWWYRTANTLNALEQLKKRNKVSDMQIKAAKTCRLLALEGLPPLGKRHPRQQDCTEIYGSTGL